jgi:hypothetical protein
MLLKPLPSAGWSLCSKHEGNPTHLRDKLGGVLRVAFLRLVVDVRAAETGVVPIRPLEIVQKTCDMISKESRLTREQVDGRNSVDGEG